MCRTDAIVFRLFFTILVPFLHGCGASRMPCPDQRLGITRISTAYTLPNDPNPAKSVTNLLESPSGSSASVFATESTLQQLSDPKYSSLLYDDELGTYRISLHSGGASLLTPRHLLLSNHQLIWESTRNRGTIYLHDARPSLNTASIIASDTTIAGGWTLLLLDLPIDSPAPIPLAPDPKSHGGQPCLIPIARSTFQKHNAAGMHKGQICTIDDLVIVRGVVLDSHPDQLSEILDPSELQDNNFLIEIDAQLDMHGASGFPVLVHDPDLDAWIMIATAVSATYDKRHTIDKCWVHAIAVDREIKERINPPTR